MLDALILGIVQGFTEFLPVSSSGHLVLVPQFFNIPTPTVAFDVLLHLATLVAVLGYFSRDVVKILASVFAPRRLPKGELKYWRRLLAWLIIGTIPAGLAGFLLNDFFESLFSDTLAVGIFLVVTSVLLVGSDIALGLVRREPSAGLERMRASDALIVGCFQALAIAPGLSRSGTTIAGGIFLGFDRATAARYSFLLSIPAILGAFVFKLKDISGGFGGGSGGAYAVGALAALISGFVAVYFLMRYLKNHRLRIFAIYTAALGLFVIILSLV